jgi:hypothetical protein
MRKHAFLGVAVVAAALMLTALATAQGPVRDDMLRIDTGDIRGPGCSTVNNASGMIDPMTTPLSTPLYNHTSRPGLGVFPTCNPILAPDGHTVTWGEYKAAQGSATVKCINTGTHTALHFSGLLPKGVYSVWLLVENTTGPGFSAVGTLGRTGLSENHFIASEAGEGQISRTTPAENLSVFGSVGSCFLDSPAQLHLVYHSDGLTHGTVPGPTDTWVVNARFFFNP